MSPTHHDPQHAAAHLPPVLLERTTHEIIGAELEVIRDRIQRAIEETNLVIHAGERGHVEIECDTVVTAFPTVARVWGEDADGRLEELLDQIAPIFQVYPFSGCGGAHAGSCFTAACAETAIAIVWQPTWVGFANGTLIAKWEPELDD